MQRSSETPDGALPGFRRNGDCSGGGHSVRCRIGRQLYGQRMPTQRRHVQQLRQSREYPFGRVYAEQRSRRQLPFGQRGHFFRLDYPDDPQHFRSASVVSIPRRGVLRRAKTQFCSTKPKVSPSPAEPRRTGPYTLLSLFFSLN